MSTLLPSGQVSEPWSYVGMHLLINCCTTTYLDARCPTFPNIAFAVQLKYFSHDQVTPELASYVTPRYRNCDPH